MASESIFKSKLYTESHERRRIEQERVLMFANYLDSLPGEVQDDIRDTAWRIASETVDAVDTDDGWYGGSAFKKTLERILKRYLSGFDRDTDSLLSQGVKSAGDREVAQQAITAAEQELSRFSELQLEASDDDIDDGEKKTIESGADEGAAGEAIDGESETVHSAWSQLDAAAGVNVTGAPEEGDNRTEPPFERRKEKTVWGDRRAEARRHLRDTHEKERQRQEDERQEDRDRERLNQELRSIQEEMSEWKVNSPLHYEHAVDVLVNQHGLSPEDAMRLVNQINTMSSWRTQRTIRDVRRSYFLETRESLSKERGKGFSR